MLKKVLIVSILFCVCISCDENVSSTIPNAPVSLVLDLAGRDNALNGSLAFKEYIRDSQGNYSYNNPLATDRLGYGGILVIHGLGENILNLYAFELACPNEAVSNIRVKPESSGLTAVCPECKAVYNIASGGAPHSGSKFWLKRYDIVPVSETRFRVKLI